MIIIIITSHLLRHSPQYLHHHYHRHHHHRNVISQDNHHHYHHHHYHRPSLPHPRRNNHDAPRLLRSFTSLCSGITSGERSPYKAYIRENLVYRCVEQQDMFHLFLVEKMLFCSHHPSPRRRGYYTKHDQQFMLNHITL